MRMVADSAMHLLNYLWRIYNKILKEGQRFLRRYGLTPTRLDVIALLSTGEGITQQELSEKLLTTKGNITSLIDRMERDGLVERRVDVSDRRRYRLFLTPKSKRLLEQVIPEYKKRLIELIDSLSAEERALLQSLLKRLEQSLPQSSAGETIAS
ncbi:MAG: MarR family transcriptional regulator [Armatimonadota bacterium]|nr:MarR family transcriptional regulator [Armatimonadota bacterium]MCX7777245.1 MarR family transcriptional regulator [Armatimonadota bacterium]MDW8024660.1 MarR family transcriptional regulator [Armatimonadota bacterium]